MRIRLCAALAAVIVLATICPACRSPYYADRGALVGGLTGALAGAAIGENNGNAAAGAVLGSAAGAVAGAAIGETIDAEVAHSQAVIQERLGRQLAGAATMADVVAMTQAGVGDDVIVTHIRAHGVAQRPRAADVIDMTRQGVSEPVINAMQETPAPQYVAGPPVVAPPVIVEEHHYGPLFPPPWHYRHHHHHARHPRRSKFSWGFSYHR